MVSGTIMWQSFCGVYTLQMRICIAYTATDRLESSLIWYKINQEIS